MPSIFTHALVPLAARLALGRGRIGNGLLVAGIGVAMLPDADVAAFVLGIPYADGFGHRGASHSLLFALLVAAVGAWVAWWRRFNVGRSALFLFVCTISHPLLDAMTSGGLGVALGWPLFEARWFAPWRPIRVSPIGAAFFSARGLQTLWSEMRWVGVPLLSAAALWRLGHMRAKPMKAP